MIRRRQPYLIGRRVADGMPSIESISWWSEFCSKRRDAGAQRAKSVAPDREDPGERGATAEAVETKVQQELLERPAAQAARVLPDHMEMFAGLLQDGCADEYGPSTGSPFLAWSRTRRRWDCGWCGWRRRLGRAGDRGFDDDHARASQKEEPQQDPHRGLQDVHTRLLEAKFDRWLIAQGASICKFHLQFSRPFSHFFPQFSGDIND